MNSMIKLLATLLCCMLSLSLHATSKPLQFQNKPIDPLCFYNLEKDVDTINLKQCGIQKNNKYVQNGQNSKLIKMGYFGFNWTEKVEAGNYEGYSYYKYFKGDNKGFWVFTVNNGGGNGEFTQLLWITQNSPDVLTSKPIMGGDRCNGGIQPAKRSPNGVTFSENLTAFALITKGKNYNAVKAFDDLADCAACCSAKAVYKIDSDKHQLQYIDLGNTKNIEEMPNQGTKQACFNKLVSSYVSQGHSHLNSSELDEFIKKFDSDCYGTRA